MSIPARAWDNATISSSDASANPSLRRVRWYFRAWRIQARILIRSSCRIDPAGDQREGLPAAILQEATRHARPALPRSRPSRS